MQRSDNLVFADETTNRTENHEDSWKILLVDDEPEVHDVTVLALHDFEYKQRKATFYHAYSADQAKQLLQQHPDMVMALIDVVMETDDAGIDLVEWIRNDLNNPFIRLIMRTGQPGQAPEKQVVLDHDINDYKEKSELTSSKLYTLLVTSIRSYEILHSLEKSRNGLVKIVNSSRSLSTHGTIEMFVEGVLMQLQSVFNVEETAFYCSQSDNESIQLFSRQDFLVATGVGEFKGTRKVHLRDIQGSALEQGISQTIHAKKTQFIDDSCYVYFRSDSGNQCVVFINRLNQPLDDTEKGLLDVFCNNINIAFDNLTLNQKLKSE